MKHRLALALLLIAVSCAAAAPAQRIDIDFEHVQAGQILDGAGAPRAKLEGGARVSPNGDDGGAALDLGGAARKGVASFGKAFASDKQGTVEFRCKPRSLSGILVGKYGAINIEFTRGQRRVSFGLKLKEQRWVHCKSATDSIKPNQWLRVKASWGPQGMLLFLDGKLVAHAALPESFEWFIADRNFLLGSYDWPAGYDVWFFDGLIDDFSYRPEQDPLAGELPTPKAEPAVLELRLKHTPKPNYGAALPPIVRGRVALDANGNGVVDQGEGGLAAVSVSDGYSVVKTDGQGVYSLKPSRYAVFVFITRPSGYDVAGSWYKPVAGQVDFTLNRSDRGEDEFTFVQLTDSHTSTDRRSLVGLSQFVSEVNALAPRPRFVFNSGDLVNLDKQLKASASTGRQYFRNYTGIMNHLQMPYYNVAGDHTDSGYRLGEFPRGDPRAGKAMYWEYLGPNLFSFEYGRLHFVSVDVVYHLAKKSYTMVPEHVAWFEQDLKARGDGTIVLTASENPLDQSIPGFVGLAKQHAIRLQLVGDTHVVSFKRNPVPSLSHGALSGTWWNGPCADLHPQGYMIYQVRGTAMDRFYKGLGERVSIVSPAYGDLAGGMVTLRAHLVQPRAGEALHCSVNGSAWQTMKEIGRPFYRALYEATWDSRAAPDGLARIRIKCTPGDEVRARTFVVDNDKPHDAYAEDATLSFAVGAVIGAARLPAGKVDVLVNARSVGALLPGKRKPYTFTVPGRTLRKVNTLTFRFAKPDDATSITNPMLTFRGRAIEDPRAAATQKVRANHWPARVVSRAGFVLGEDQPETSFALRQSAFHFVLP